jgi:hypothetical protein
MAADGGFAAWAEESLKCVLRRRRGSGQTRRGTDRDVGIAGFADAEAVALLLLAVVFPKNGYGTQLFEYYTSIPDPAGHRGRA